jgi:lysophospholipase L1-like esterase
MNRVFVLSLLLGISSLANAYFVVRHCQKYFDPYRVKPLIPSVQAGDSVLYSESCRRFRGALNSRCRLLFIGDSIANLLVHDLEDKRDVGDLEKFWLPLVDGGLRNRCIPSVTTVGIDQMLDRAAMPQAEEIFLWLGINDLSGIRTVPEVENNYREILAKLRLAEPNAHLVILSVLPVRDGITEPNISVRALNLRLLALAKETGAEFIDVRPALVDAHGDFDASLTSDGVHPKGPALTRIENIISGKEATYNAALPYSEDTP